MIHEDTLDAITFVCDRLEETMFEPSERWEGDEGQACVSCGLRFWMHSSYERPATPEDQRHRPDCELVAKLAALRAFVRVQTEVNERTETSGSA